MKVFFTASQRGKEKFGKHYAKIAESVKALGYTLLEDDLLTMKSDDFYKDMTTQKRGSGSFYKEELKKLQDAEINIFDCSFHSLSIGFIIEKSLEFSKPTIVLYHQDHTPHFLMGISEEKLVIKGYNDKNIQTVIKDTLNEAKQQRDKRFNFFISPRLLNYLEKASKTQAITKSRFIRDLILEHRKKNQPTTE